MIPNKDKNTEIPQCVQLAVSGGIGIKVDVNPYNDPRWSNRTGVHEEHKIDVLRVYSLKGNKVSFKKPKKEDCVSVVCFDQIPYGVPVYKIKNYNQLPNELPFNQDILDTYFFHGKAVVV